MLIGDINNGLLVYEGRGHEVY